MYMMWYCDGHFTCKPSYTVYRGPKNLPVLYLTPNFYSKIFPKIFHQIVFFWWAIYPSKFL
jgi:hypothetical protein